MRTLLFLSLSLSLVACGDDDSRPVDSGSGVDTGTPVLPDGGGTDTGTGTDSGMGVDSGMTMTGMCPAGVCDLITNAGCDSTMGQGCYFDSMDRSVLCVAAGAGAEGATCESVNDCREGLTCDEGECRKVCCGGSDANCSTGDICVSFSAMDGTPFGFGACRTPSGCNVIDQTGCDAPTACYIISGDGSTDCITPPASGGVQNAECMFLNECAPGFLCLGSGCSRACNPMADACGEGLVCARVEGFPDTLGGCVPEM